MISLKWWKKKKNPANLELFTSENIFVKQKQRKLQQHTVDVSTTETSLDRWEIFPGRNKENCEEMRSTEKSIHLWKNIKEY